MGYVGSEIRFDPDVQCRAQAHLSFHLETHGTCDHTVVAV